MPSNRVPSAAVVTSGAPSSVFGGGGSAEALISHINDPVDAHAASAVSYDGGPNWADGTPNDEVEVESQIDEMVSDLSDTTSTSSGARKMGVESTMVGTVTNAAGTLYSRLIDLQGAVNINYAAGPAWKDTTANPATNVQAQIDKVITDLGAGSTGAEKITFDGGLGGTYFNGSSLGSEAVGSGIREVVSDLGASTGTDGAALIGSLAHVSTGSFGSVAASAIRTQLDILFDNAVHLGNVNTISGNNTHSGNNLFSGDDTHSGSNVFSGTLNTFSGNNTFSGTLNTFSGTTLTIGATTTFSLATTMNALLDLNSSLDVLTTLTVGGISDFNSAVSINHTGAPITSLHIGNATVSAGITGEAVLGKATVGTWNPGSSNAYFANAQFDQTSSATYALRQDTTGETFINSAPGGDIYFRNSDVTAGFIQGSSGEWGLGTTAPTHKLHVQGSDGAAGSPTTELDGIVRFEYNTNNFPKQTLVIDMNDPAGGASDVFIGFFNDNGRVGSIHSEVIYGTFTGQHPTPIPRNAKFDEFEILDENDELLGRHDEEEGPNWTTEPSLRDGMILVTAGIWYRKGFSNALPYTNVSTTAQDVQAFGVYGGYEGWNLYGQGLTTYMCNAIGEGHVMVTDTNGNISAGDYICTSTRYGHGEKQADDLLHNYTVAKATEVIDFSSVLVDPEFGYKSVLVACTYHCG